MADLPDRVPVPPPAPAGLPLSAPQSPRVAPAVIVQLIGGVTVLGAGVGLLLAGEHAVGGALVAAGAAELGVKITTLAQ